ncbi:MAG: hypothetical protein P8J68_05570 [Arenicellaceae bacterium]|nr:hypothetical protein [Arenicellaceae bacterium]
MSLKTSRFKPWLAIVTIGVSVSVSVSAQPQVPPCGTLKVSKDTKIETRLFQKGTYQIHAVGISCKEVIGRDGLFAKFLSLGDDVPLPEPWESLIGVVGARKFVAGPGIGIRAQRISD